MYFFFDLSIKIFEVIVISVVKFFVACLVSEISKANELSAILFYNLVYCNNVTRR